MVCCCSMAGTKNCLYCSNRDCSINGYNFLGKSKYGFSQIERIIIEFPKIETYTTTSTIPYENR